VAKRRWRGSHSASGNLAAAVQAVYISVSLETRQALEIWRDYNGRATVVCRIDELAADPLLPAKWIRVLPAKNTSRRYATTAFVFRTCPSNSCIDAASSRSIGVIRPVRGTGRQ